jgi:mannosyltransferase
MMTRNTPQDDTVVPVGSGEWACLGVILVVAAVLRGYRLESSLWHDEIVTLVEFVRLPPRELVAAFSLNNHMFFSLQAQASIAAFSETAWALRLPAALFGITSIVAQWHVARRLVGPVQALVTAALLTVSYHHVWFSQNARGYTGLLFWTTMATWLFAQGLARPRTRTWAGYAVAVAAALYTHLSASFFLATHAVVYAAVVLWEFLRPGWLSTHPAFAGARSRGPIVGMLAAVGLTLALHAPILGQVSGTVGGVASGSALPGTGLDEWLSPARALQEIVAAMSAGVGPWPLVVAGAGVLLFAGVGSLARRLPAFTAVYVLSVPIALLTLLAVGFRIWPRYFFVDIGFLCLAAVHGAFVVGGYAGRRLSPARIAPHAAAVATGLLLAAMLVVSSQQLARNYRHPKQDYAGAAAFVERERAPGDEVAAVGLARFGYGRYYAPAWKGVDTVPDLERLMAVSPRTWIVVAFPHQTAGARPAITARLQADFDRVAVFRGTLGDGAIWVYRSR